MIIQTSQEHLVEILAKLAGSVLNEIQTEEEKEVLGIILSFAKTNHEKLVHVICFCDMVSVAPINNANMQGIAYIALVCAINMGLTMYKNNPTQVNPLIVKSGFDAAIGSMLWIATQLTKNIADLNFLIKAEIKNVEIWLKSMESDLGKVYEDANAEQAKILADFEKALAA